MRGSLRKPNGENEVEVWAYRPRGVTERSEADCSVLKHNIHRTDAKRKTIKHLG